MFDCSVLICVSMNGSIWLHWPHDSASPPTTAMAIEASQLPQATDDVPSQTTPFHFTQFIEIGSQDVGVMRWDPNPPHPTSPNFLYDQRPREEPHGGPRQSDGNPFLNAAAKVFRKLHSQCFRRFRLYLESPATRYRFIWARQGSARLPQS